MIPAATRAACPVVMSPESVADSTSATAIATHMAAHSSASAHSDRREGAAAADRAGEDQLVAARRPPRRAAPRTAANSAQAEVRIASIPVARNSM